MVCLEVTTSTELAANNHVQKGQTIQEASTFCITMTMMAVLPLKHLQVAANSILAGSSVLESKESWA